MQIENFKIIRMERNESIKVLVVTFEYKEKVTGGIGRVINGIDSMMQDKIIFDVFLMEWRYLTLCFSGTHYLHNKLNTQINRYYKNYLTCINQLIKKYKYNIVHILHNGKESSILAEMIKTRFPDIKIIFSCHSIARYEQMIRNNSIQELSYEKLLIENTDHIHLLNQSSANYFQQSYPDTDPDSITIIPNGIEEKDYRLMDEVFYHELIKQTNKGKNYIITCLSRWSHGKGIEKLLDAIPEVIKVYPNCKFIVAGKKNKSWENEADLYVKEIDKKIEQLKYHVIPIGWLNETKRNALFKLTDIVVMPSQLEYFPYSLLEPMICKVPIVSSNIDCAKELLIEDMDCLFFEKEKADDLARQLLKLIGNPETGYKLAANAYLKIRNQLNWPSIGQQYISMYKSALKQSSLIIHHSS